MFENEIKTLKQKLISDHNFRDIWDYFFTHLAEKREFLRYGEITNNESIVTMLKLVSKRLFKDEPFKISNFLQIKIKEFDLIHGPCFLNSRMANFFYFEDICMGLFSILVDPIKSETSFIRLTSFAADKSDVDINGLKESREIYCPGSKTIH